MAKNRQKDPLKEHVIQKIAGEAANESVKLLRHVCPIYRPDKNGDPEQFGTGVFILAGARYFLVTAAHVLDDNAESTLYIPGEKSGALVELKGESFRSKPDDGDRKNDRTDVGVVLLSQDLADEIGREAFLSVKQIDVDETGTPGATYIALGYPWRKNAKLNRSKKSVTRHPLSYTANVLQNKKLAKLGVHNGSHLLLGFDKRHSRNKEGRDITTPNPEGMSGGALWKFDVCGDQTINSRLVGVLIEWTSELRGILAVRLPVILAGIAHAYPDVADQIPQTLTVKVSVHEAAEET